MTWGGFIMFIGDQHGGMRPLGQGTAQNAQGKTWGKRAGTWYVVTSSSSNLQDVPGML